MPLHQLFHKGLLQGEDGVRRHQHHQQLAGGKAPADQHVPEPPEAAALVKDLDLEVLQHVPDVPQHRVGGGVLDQAVLHRNDGVALRLIDPADRAAFPVQPEGPGDLVAVAGGLVHAQDGLHVAEPAQQADTAAHLAPQLLLIGQALQLAAAAFFEIRAGRCVDALHLDHLFSFSMEYCITHFPVCKDGRT